MTFSEQFKLDYTIVFHCFNKHNKFQKNQLFIVQKLKINF